MQWLLFSRKFTPEVDRDSPQSLLQCSLQSSLRGEIPQTVSSEIVQAGWKIAHCAALGSLVGAKLSPREHFSRPKA
jgi:hypothetical protein